MVAEQINNEHWNQANNLPSATSATANLTRIGLEPNRSPYWNF